VVPDGIFLPDFFPQRARVLAVVQSLLSVSVDQYDRATVKVYPGRGKVFPFDRGAVDKRSGDLLMSKDWFAMVRPAVRPLVPVIGATEYVTDPLPLPAAPEAIVTQELLLTAVQLQPAGTVTGVALKRRW
jgi:hypothetical protein